VAIILKIFVTQVLYIYIKYIKILSLNFIRICSLIWFKIIFWNDVKLETFPVKVNALNTSV
jgi:hypothetical protein